MTAPLIIGYGREGTFAHFAELARAAAPTIRVLDLHRVEDASRVSIRHRVGGMDVSIDEEKFEVGSSSVFYRGFYRAAASTEASTVLHHFLSELESGLQLLPASCLVLNRPLAGVGNSSKARHIRELSECGFRVPRTIVSSIPARVESIVAPNGRWINKGCSGTRTIAAAVNGVEAARTSLLEYCPSLFQPRIGGYDVRAHVTVQGCVALRIVSNRVDYRYATRQGGCIEVERIELPAIERFRALEFMRRSGLCFAGFDFKVDEKDQWWLLEANPMPGFEFFDRFALNGIGELVLRTLQLGCASGGRPECGYGTFIEEDRFPDIDKAQ